MTGIFIGRHTETDTEGGGRVKIRQKVVNTDTNPGTPKAASYQQQLERQKSFKSGYESRLILIAVWPWAIKNNLSGPQLPYVENSEKNSPPTGGCRVDEMTSCVPALGFCIGKALWMAEAWIFKPRRP